MERKKILLMILAMLGLTIATLLHIYSNPQENQTTMGLNAKTFKTNSGFGYMIIANQEQTIIKQEHIPAINDNVSFVTEKQAKKVAELVITRLTNGESPIIQVDDLKKLHITIPMD